MDTVKKARVSLRAAALRGLLAEAVLWLDDELNDSTGAVDADVLLVVATEVGSSAGRLRGGGGA